MNQINKEQNFFEPYLTTPYINGNYSSSKNEYLQRIEQQMSSLNNHSTSNRYWENYEARTYNWKQWICFMIPIGIKNVSYANQLLDAGSQLININNYDAFPTQCLYLPISFVGFLKPDGIMWSQVESFYVNASPRLHRIEPFNIQLLKIAYDEETISIVFDDNYAFKEIRHQLQLGVPHINAIYKNNDSYVKNSIDNFMPKINIGYFSQASYQEVNSKLESVEISESKLDIDTIYLVRMSADPQIKLPQPDIIAEIPLMGSKHRTGYHN
ncbi:MAG: hypothetical protein P8J51_04810 [Dehalococcoidia bacterium]|nr:hypothetical protein [Dehalococcoidia bacterium]